MKETQTKLRLLYSRPGIFIEVLTDETLPTLTTNNSTLLTELRPHNLL